MKLDVIARIKHAIHVETEAALLHDLVDALHHHHDVHALRQIRLLAEAHLGRAADRS